MKIRDEFLQYAKYDERLIDLENTVITFTKANKTSKNRRKYHVADVWYGYGKYAGKGLKQKISGLVGYTAVINELNNSKAYDVVYKYFYDLL